MIRFTGIMGRLVKQMFVLGQSERREGRQEIQNKRRDQSVLCLSSSVQWGDTVKALVDSNAPVSSQERAAEEAALLGLFCNLYSLIAALRVVALQLLVHFCFDVSGKR